MHACVVAVAIWIGGSWITARYLASGGGDVLGILGGATGLLIWLYIMASGILIGAQVNVAVQTGRPDADTRHDPPADGHDAAAARADDTPATEPEAAGDVRPTADGSVTAHESEAEAASTG